MSSLLAFVPSWWQAALTSVVVIVALRVLLSRRTSRGPPARLAIFDNHTLQHTPVDVTLSARSSSLGDMFLKRCRTNPAAPAYYEKVFPEDLAPTATPGGAAAAATTTTTTTTTTAPAAAVTTTTTAAEPTTTTTNAGGMAGVPMPTLRKGGKWQRVTWAEYETQVRRMARGLVQTLGLKPGDRVCVLGPTAPKWTIVDWACHVSGLVSVGIYPKQTVEQTRYIIEHSECRVVFVESRAELDKVLEACSAPGSTVSAIVPWEDAVLAEVRGAAASASAAADARLVSWSSLVAGEPLDEAAMQARMAARGENETAIIIYTSGTTGPPKGAMISHLNVLSLLRNVQGRPEFAGYQDDLHYCFLPMAHAAERVLSCYGRTCLGQPVAFASSIAAILVEINEVRPTVFGSVPRIFEKAYGKIRSEIALKPLHERLIVRWSEGVGRRYVRLLLSQPRQPIPPLLALQYRVADALVFSTVRRQFLGGRCTKFVTGAAPIALEILEFFWMAGLPIFEMYGMTEATVITHTNGPDATRLGSVGRAIGSLEHRIAPEDGEILLRAPWVFRGYFKNDAATRDTVDTDGWLHTGDIGTIDADGYLCITDRKKHLIITSGGKNITPANIEKAIKTEDPLISQVHAHGDQRPCIVAIVAPSPSDAIEFGVTKGIISKAECNRLLAELLGNPYARSPELNAATALAVAHPDFVTRIREAVVRGNKKLSQVERVKKFWILPRDFSQEEGELTPTMKVKRRDIEAKFKDSVFDPMFTPAAKFGLDVYLGGGGGGGGDE